jgi:hypothetical protein
MVELIEAGADLFRLNFSHGTREEHAENVAWTREAAKITGQEIGILGDLPGPKLRIGDVTDGIVGLRPGSEVVLSTAEGGLGTEERLPISYEGLPEAVSPEGLIYLADGRIRLRVLETGDEPGAKLAIDYFVYRIGLFAGMLAAALGGLDAFVFTAGIGENSAGIRSRIAEKLQWLGAEMDVKANVAQKSLISQPDSRVKIFVIPTDEELMIAEHTLALISAARSAREPAGDGGARRQNVTI